MLRPVDRAVSNQVFWTGEFRDPATEHRYRIANHPAQRKHMTLLAVIIMIMSWPIILADYLVAADAENILNICLTRAVAAASPVTWIIMLRRNASYRTLDILLLAFAIYVGLETAVLIDLFSTDTSVMASRAPLFIMIANVMFPIAARQRVAMNLIGIVVIGGAFWMFAESPTQALASLSSILLSAHLFGFAAGTWLAHLRRAEFARSTELELANAALLRSSQQMEEANAAKSIFLSNVSHELRTPLNAIIGFAEMLQHRIFGPLGDKRYDGYAEDIAHSGRLLRDLIDDLLDLNKVEAGKLDMRPEWTVTPGAADDWLKMVRMAARPQGADRISADALPQVEMLVDRRAFQQIIVNLLTNALKYAGDGARISLTGETDDQGRLHIGVIDNGVGMTGETVSRLLRPFEQADARIARKADGWGLGLPLANALATANGGTLSIESALGSGTRAMVILPASLVRPIGQATAA